jgi:hypothetical protein
VELQDKVIRIVNADLLETDAKNTLLRTQVATKSNVLFKVLVYFVGV